jgi:hypothetical protein
MPGHNVWGFGANWVAVTPRVHRYMTRQHVDEFFEFGKLRLSSFVAFGRHPYEKLRDAFEGWIQHEHVGGAGDKKSFVSADKKFGQQSYVLCASSESNAFEKFHHTACITIKDTAQFANFVAREVPFFCGGFEGHCVYTGRFESKDRGDPPSLDDLAAFAQWLGLSAKPDLFLVKDPRYSHEVEYRLVFNSNKPVSESIDIVLPRAAVDLCEPGYATNALTVAS